MREDFYSGLIVGLVFGIIVGKYGFNEPLFGAIAGLVLGAALGAYLQRDAERYVTKK